MNTENNNVTLNDHEKGEFKRVLGLGSLVMFGLAYMAPTVVFNYYGNITVVSQGMYSLCMLCTAVAMFFTAFSYANMTKAYQLSGSAYVYVQKSINPHLGFLTGWVMLLDYLLLPMVCYLCVAVYLEAYVPGVPAWLWVVILVLICFIINAFGINSTAKVDTIIVGAQILMMLVFITIGIIVTCKGGINGTGNGLFDPTAFYNPDLFEVKLIMYPAAILCVSFLGFDAVSTLSEEAKDAEKNVPKAIILTCLGAGLLFTIIAYISQVVWPVGYQEIEDPDTGIFQLLSLFPYIPHLDVVFLVIDNVGSVACALSGQAAVVRIMYNMGRDNILPKKIFGKMSEKHGVPIYNLIMVSLVGLVAIFFTDYVLSGAELVSFGAITGFILVNLSVPMHYLKKKGERGAKAIFMYGVMPAIGIIICSILWWNIAPKGKIIGFIWLAVGVIVLAIQTKGFRQLPPEMDID